MTTSQKWPVVFFYPESRKGGSAMKAVCIKSYYDKQLKRKVRDHLRMVSEDCVSTEIKS